MCLTTGQTLTFYEILGPLGAGGMGEVYSARDTRLEREVAIKVLPEELADDEERLRRFEREAKMLATLNHTNIAGIHGIDQVGETCFLAMELVPGEDLEERLRSGALPVDEALEVCRQIAEGLEAAHEAGVVHRDLKPANVRITLEGAVKLLDFELAKPILPKSSGESTTTAESEEWLEGVFLDVDPDMRHALVAIPPDGMGTDLLVVDLATLEQRDFRVGQGPVLSAAISPDGEWALYSTRGIGSTEVMLTRFPSGEGEWPVSVDGGRDAKFSPDGSETTTSRASATSTA